MSVPFPEFHLFQILKRYENQYLPLDLFLGNYFRANKALGSKDRQLISEAAFGMIRWKLLLDFLVSNPSTWEKRYSVYRYFQPEQYLSINSIPLHVRVSCPKTLFSLLENQYGVEKAIKICQVCNTPAPITIRINPLKTTREALLEKWADHYDIAPCENSQYGILFKKRAPLTAMEEFKQGLFEIQDEASQIAASLIAPNPGDHVLDFCAGSGGKTLGFAHLTGNKGQIYLHDIRPFILEQAKKRLRRAGVQNAQFLEKGHLQLGKLKRKMDWVLVDAPCSGTGTLRRNPDQKWKFDPEMLKRLIEEQREIFSEAFQYVGTKGKIVYATCSLLKEENEEQVDYFLKNFPLKLTAPPFVSLPEYGSMDGFFTAVFEV